MRLARIALIRLDSIGKSLDGERRSPQTGIQQYEARTSLGTAEQWIKEGRNAIKWTRLSCQTLSANEVRLQLHALAYDLADFMRILAPPRRITHWLLTTVREKLVKIGVEMVRHGR